MNERELRILRSAVGILRMIQQDIRAICQQHRAGGKEEKPPTQVDIQSPIRLPLDVRDYYESEQRDRPSNTRRENIRLLFEGVALGAAILAGVFTYRTLRQVTRQADNAQEQLKFSINSFRTNERAWIGVEMSKPTLKAAGNNKFTAAFTYELNARNTGKTVARCVEIRSPRQASLSSLTNTENKKVIDNEQDNFLLGKFKGSADIPINRSAPKTLAPGQVTPVPLTFAGQAPKDNFGSTFVGRVDYIDEFRVRHWVKFCFFIEDSKGELGYCKYGNDEDNNPEVPPSTDPVCPVTPFPMK